MIILTVKNITYEFKSRLPLKIVCLEIFHFNFFNLLCHIVVLYIILYQCIIIKNTLYKKIRYDRYNFLDFLLFYLFHFFVFHFSYYFISLYYSARYLSSADICFHQIFVFRYLFAAYYKLTSISHSYD